MHRFFVRPDSFRKEGLVLLEDQARQINDVLRLRVGDVIVAMDNAGSEFRVKLTHVSSARVQGHITERLDISSEPKTCLVLYQALLKADKFEWLLQKGTEVGISEFVPMVTSRVIMNSVSRAKVKRWERILREAAEQSGRGKIPQLRDLQLFGDALSDGEAKGGVAFIPWEREESGSLRAMLSTASRNGPVCLFIGPEGGFTSDEIEAARAHRITPVSLGPRILRAETAGLVAASAILFARGELDLNRPDR